jgi:GxxExxY protein
VEHSEVSAIIVDAAMRVHRELGPGLLESVYQQILAYELRQRGLHVETEVPIPVVWREIRFDIGFRADLVVERMVLVELKSIETVAPVHKKKLLTYITLADMRLGLLINFGCELLKDGVFRVVNRLAE